MRVRTCTLRWAALAAAAGSVAVAADARAAFGDRPLRRGMHGHDVRVLQSWLTQLGLPTAVDGRFGPRTARHVRTYERRAGLRVDGRVSRVQARGIRRRIERAPAAPAAGGQAVLAADGRTAVAPAGAPPPVVAAIAAANRIVTTPYRYGGGHREFEDSAYDRSGAASYALHGAGVLARPQDSSELMAFGEGGPGRMDHGLLQPRPRLRRDRRPAVRHLGARRDGPALAAGAALRAGLLGPASGGPVTAQSLAARPPGAAG